MTEYQYRTEQFAGEGYRDAVDVMTHETVELGNRDIVKYLLEHYVRRGGLEEAALKGLLREDDEVGRAHGEWRCRLYVKSIFEMALACIKKQTGKDIKYVLWLADLTAVKHQYGRLSGPNYEIDRYDVTDAVVLSDLGYDGRLYGFAREPRATIAQVVEERKGEVTA